VFDKDGMKIFRYKSKDAALFFQSLLRLMQIQSKIIPVTIEH
jgi:hypothetical protein